MNTEYINFSSIDNDSLFGFNFESKSPLNYDFFGYEDECENELSSSNLKFDFLPNEDNNSILADGGSQNGDIKRLDSFLTKETKSSGNSSQNGDDVKAKKRPIIKVQYEDLEDYVRKEIEEEGYNNVIALCLLNSEEEKKEKVIMRRHNNKSKNQLKRLRQALIQFPKKFPIHEREKLSREIGLSEEQIYRWYYENNPNIGKKRKTVSSRRTSKLF